jgi:hypothetical protein
MRYIKVGLFFILVFIGAVFIAVYIQDYFREFVRYLYVLLSNGKIKFIFPKKYFNSPSYPYVLSFGFFNVLFCVFIYKKNIAQKIGAAILSVGLFFLSIVAHCYFDGLFKIMECTSCKDGTRVLKTSDIKYDTIFIAGLVAAILPLLASFVIKNIQTRNSKYP